MPPTPYPSWTAFEQAVLNTMNTARTAPSGYAQKLDASRAEFDGRLRRPLGRIAIVTEEGVAAVEEAIRFLQSASPLPPLEHSDGMAAAARDHVRDQGRTGRTGHGGSDGSTSWERMNRYGQWQARSAENIQYGADSPEDVVASLIVDDGVSDRGHRENIFDPYSRIVGVACGPHPVYRVMCVTTFAAGYVEGTSEGPP